MRAVVVILVLLDLWAGVGGPPFVVIALAYMRLEGLGAALAGLVFFLCWAVAPWAALVIAWRQSRRGASRGRIAVTLLIPLVLALLAGGLLGSLPMKSI